MPKTLDELTKRRDQLAGKIRRRTKRVAKLRARYSRAQEKLVANESKLRKVEAKIQAESQQRELVTA